MQNSFSKKLGLSLAAFGLVATSLFTAQNAEAVPAFARQTGNACNSCHFQSFPALNAMGRDFKAMGYTAKGSQGAIEDEEQALDLPETLNVSAFAKLRHKTTNGGTNMGKDFGELEYPDEIALLLGGRATANAGFLWEVNLAGTDVEGTADADGNVEGGAGTQIAQSKFVNKLTTMGETQILASVFSTDGMGPSYGYELLNTGLQSSQRPIESKPGFNAAYNVGMLHAATGITFAAYNPSFYVTYTKYAPGHGGGEGKLSALADYIRAVGFMDMGDLELAAGIALQSGQVGMPDDANGAVDPLKLGATAMDVQIQGEMGGMPIGIYITQASATGESFPAMSNGTTDGNSSTGLLVKVEPTLDYEVYFGTTSGTYGTHDIGDTVIGFRYQLAQNVMFEFFQDTYANEYWGAKKTGSSDTTTSEQTLMLGMAF